MAPVLSYGKKNNPIVRAEDDALANAESVRRMAFAVESYCNFENTDERL